jgi:hypothetical protein
MKGASCGQGKRPMPDVQNFLSCFAKLRKKRHVWFSALFWVMHQSPIAASISPEFDRDPSSTLTWEACARENLGPGDELRDTHVQSLKAGIMGCVDVFVVSSSSQLDKNCHSDSWKFPHFSQKKDKRELHVCHRTLPSLPV